MTERENFIMDDIKKHNSQSSWDWEADLRFAYKFFPERAEILAQLVNGSAPAGVRMSIHDEYAKVVKRARLKVLSVLVKKGHLISFWRGTGDGGMAFFGTNKIKAYFIRHPSL